MKRKNLYLNLWLMAVIVLLTGCTKEEVLDRTEDYRTGVTLTAVAESMSPEQIITRASDPKNEAEREIHSLHVFLFGPDGNYLTRKTNNDLYQGYQYIGSPTLYIDGDAFADPTAASSATIYVVANVEAGTFGSITAEGYPEKIRNKTDFETFYYQPTHRTTVTVLPESGMPMAGFATGINLTQTNGSIVIEMKALMARIDFTFHIDASNGTIGGLPSLNLTECEVRNATTAVPFLPLGDDKESNLDMNNDGQTDATTSIPLYLDPTSNILYNRQDEATFSFYVYENRRNPGYPGYPNAYEYPTGADPDHYQRYKPLLAINADNDTIPATYVVFKGLFTDADDIDYQATCTIFLGNDPEDDFNVTRNHLYRNNVTISGITAAGNTPSDVVTFDARIDVEHTSPYYISILRHKDLDAHFNIVPLDCYLFEDESVSEIDIRIDDPQTNNWFRMERISADIMQSGQAASNQLSHPGQAFAPGTGKRRFFTQNLITDPGQLGNNTSTTLNNRDRLYIYVDENISLENRQADLILEYKENGIVKDTRTITLIQHGLMPVRVGATKTENETSVFVYEHTVYVEAHEEYLDYYDPLSQWNTEQVYDGLPWGPANMGDINTGLGIGYLLEHDAVENYYEGKKGTIAILMATGVFNKHLTWTGVQPNGPARAMILDEVPQTAAEYCYRKNKTDANGYISESNTCWFLPAIRELERTLTTYYAVYREFQENFYWSSAAAEQENNIIGIQEASEYARATMATLSSSGSIAHKSSGADQYYDPDLGSASPGGKALRTESLRIRAVYRPANGGLIEGDSYP